MAPFAIESWCSTPPAPVVSAFLFVAICRSRNKTFGTDCKLEYLLMLVYGCRCLPSANLLRVLAAAEVAQRNWVAPSVAPDSARFSLFLLNTVKQ